MATAALGAVTVIWGLTFVLVAEAVEQLAVFTFLAYRFLAATLLVGAVAGPSLRALGRDGWRAGGLAGVFLWAGYAFQTLGLERTAPSKAGFITGLFVVATPLLAGLVLRRPVGRLAWLAACTSAAGLLLLSGAGGRLEPVGDGLVLLCALAFSVHILVNDAAVTRVPLLGFVTVQLAVCGVASLVVAGLGGELEVPRSGDVWVALAVTAIGASAVGFLVQAYAQQHLAPARTAVVLAAEPAFAGVFGYVLAGDRLTALGWLGGGMMLAAILAIDLVPRLRSVPLPEG